METCFCQKVANIAIVQLKKNNLQSFLQSTKQNIRKYLHQI